MAELARVVDKASIREAVEPEVASLRHGWATKQVVAVLRDAHGPLSVADVRAAVTERTGYAVKHSTVRYILRYGRLATRGHIEAEASGRYRLS